MKKISKPILKARHKQVITYIRENRLRFIFATVCMLIFSITNPLLAWLIKPVIDEIFINKDIQMLMWIPLGVIVTYMLRGVGMYGQEFFMESVGLRIIRQLRNDLYNRIQDLPLAFFHKEQTGVLMSRITNDVNILKAMVSTAVAGALRDSFSIIGLTIVIFYRDWQLALIALVVLPIAYLPIVKFGRRVRRVSTGVQESMANLNVFLQETFLGSRIVKAFGMEPYEKKRFADKIQKLFNLEIKSVIARSLPSPIMEFLAGLGIALIIWYGGYKVINGTSTAGTFFSFMAAVIMLYDPIKKLSKLNNAIQEGLAATDRIFDIIERESDIKDPDDPVAMASGSHRVMFQNVFFKYDDVMVLKDINLDVKAGEILALVGMSGGGKTSLVNLIPRFYDVSKGGIFIDGTDIRETSISALRSQIAVVTQDPILFNDTVRNNIAYGNQEASDVEIVEAARAAYAYDFIQQFPNGFDTTIGELGSRLSGGEKQRICVARALLKDAPILILDEATSSLDSESELLVQRALENLMKGRTSFVIAHRLSTISYAHRIIVISDGRIVEEGGHEELMALQGEYYKLHQMQFNNNTG